jgi:hypothetical protein
MINSKSDDIIQTVSSANKEISSVVMMKQGATKI